MVYGFTEGPRGAAPEESVGGATTMSSGCPTGRSSCSIGSVSSIGSIASSGGSDCSVAVRVGGSTGESPSACNGKVDGGIGLCGTDGSSSGKVDTAGGGSPGVFDCAVSSQKTRILHARGSNLDSEDSSDDSMATETCFTLSVFFHITTHALSDTECADKLVPRVPRNARQ